MVLCPKSLLSSSVLLQWKIEWSVWLQSNIEKVLCHCKIERVICIPSMYDRNKILLCCINERNNHLFSTGTVFLLALVPHKYFSPTLNNIVYTAFIILSALNQWSGNSPSLTSQVFFKYLNYELIIPNWLNYERTPNQLIHVMCMYSIWQCSHYKISKLGS